MPNILDGTNYNYRKTRMISFIKFMDKKNGRQSSKDGHIQWLLLKMVLNP